MTFESLRIGSSGLVAAQKALDVTSRNLANAGNEIYSRQRILLSPMESGTGPGDGVRVVGVERIRDVLADLTYRAEVSTAEADGLRANALGRVESGLGPLTGNLPSLVNSMFDSFNQLSMSPTDPAARENVLNSARTVAAEFNRLYENMEAQSRDTQASAENIVTEVNRTLEHVASMNAIIKEAESVGVDTSGLQDERDAALDQLSKLVGARTQTGPGGDLEVAIGNYPAVSGEVFVTFELTGTGTVADPLRLTTPSGTTINVPGGQLGGAFTFVNTDTHAMQSELNAAAVIVRDQLNAAHTAGFDLTGAAGLNLFTGAGAYDLAVNSAVGGNQVAASASGAAGDGNNALAIAQLRHDTSPTGAAGATQAFVVSVGSRTQAAARASEIAQNVAEGAQDTRREISGVNIDEELIDLIRYQRAYQAAAMAVTTANEVLDTLINRMIR